MSSPKKPDIPADKLALYDKLIATHPEIESKGAANPYTSLNGHMFSLLLGPKGVMTLRLPEDEREKFLKKYGTTLYEAYGAVMRELCHRARRVAEKHKGTGKISSSELCVRQDPEAEANDEEEAAIGESIDPGLLLQPGFYRCNASMRGFS